MTKNRNSGFTLAEILIVVSLITIIAAALLFSINPIKQFFKGYDTVRKNDLTKLKSAFENYYTDHDCYPEASILKQCGSNVLEPYIDKIPCDPNSNEPYEAYMLPVDSSCPQKYAIYATLNYTTDSRGDLITYCPDTFSVSSASMYNNEVIKGCSGQELCQTIYGCKSGSCVVVAIDSLATCSPNSCDPTCGVDCTKKNRRGAYSNECREI